eukprot:ctg_1609.g446
MRHEVPRFERELPPDTGLAQLPDIVAASADSTDYAWYRLRCPEAAPGNSVLRLGVADYGQVWRQAVRQHTHGAAPQWMASGPNSPFEDRFVNDWNATEHGYGSIEIGEVCCECEYVVLVSSLGMVKGDWQLPPGGNMADERKALLWARYTTGRDGAERDALVTGFTVGLRGERHAGVLSGDADEFPFTWTSASRSPTGALRAEAWPRWYRVALALPPPDAAENKGAVIDLDGTGLEKGWLYMNGHPCGRHWDIVGTAPKNGFLLQPSEDGRPAPVEQEPAGTPTQRRYYVPEWCLQPDGHDNVLVVFDEGGGRQLPLDLGRIRVYRAKMVVDKFGCLRKELEAKSVQESVLAARARTARREGSCRRRVERRKRNFAERTSRRETIPLVTRVPRALRIDFGRFGITGSRSRPPASDLYRRVMERDGGGAADFGGLAAAVVRSRRRFLLTDRPPLDTSSALSEVPAARGTRIGLYSMDADGRGVASVRRVASAPLAWVVAGAAALGRGPAARRSAVSRTRAPADRLQSAPMRLSQTRQSGSGLPAGAERVGRRKPDGKPAMTPQPNAAAAPLSESSTPHSPRLTRLLPIEVQLVLVAMLPSPVRRESPYAQAVSEKVTRLRRLWKLKKASAPPGGRPADVDLGPTMTVSLSIERQSPSAASGAVLPNGLSLARSLVERTRHGVPVTVAPQAVAGVRAAADVAAGAAARRGTGPLGRRTGRATAGAAASAVCGAVVVAGRVPGIGRLAYGARRCALGRAGAPGGGALVDGGNVIYLYDIARLVHSLVLYMLGSAVVGCGDSSGVLAAAVFEVAA